MLLILKMTMVQWLLNAKEKKLKKTVNENQQKQKLNAKQQQPKITFALHEKTIMEIKNNEKI